MNTGVTGANMITAVIPAYNAEKTVGNIVKRTKPYVTKVIVVDDGSKDRTSLVAKKAGAKVVLHPKNMGKTAAILTGLKQAKGIVVTLDADLQHLPEEIPHLVEPVREGVADLCIGSRFLGNPEKMPLHRKLTNYLSKLAVKIRMGQWITDVQSGFRAFNQKVKDLDISSASGYEFETVVLLRALEKGLKISEVPITTIYGNPSHFNYLTDTIKVIWALLVK